MEENRIPKRGIGWEWVENTTLWLLYFTPGKETLYPLYRKEACWSPGLVWKCAENLTPNWDLIPIRSSP
jgi:hypothetical protein